ncbi:MAG: TlpA disulfide reductase family protein [Pirellulales bacterium]
MSIWALGALCLTLVGDGVSTEFIPEGVTQRVGGYRPIRVALQEKEDFVKKAPEGLVAPRFGTISYGDKRWGMICDEQEEGKQALFVDSNGDGDFTNEPAIEWKMNPNNMYQGSTKIQLSKDQSGKIFLYRFDPSDKARASLKDTVLFYTDFGSEFTYSLDGKEFKSFVSGAVSAEQPLWVDRDGNGKQSRRFEMAKIGEPFNFTGSTYVFDFKNGELSLSKSKENLPELPLPPDLTLGKQALSFKATTMNGTEVDFPKSYAGKIVMLDFWATWCGPCIGEIPHMKEAYEKHHEAGFEILGISFDQEGMAEKVQAFLKDKELPWEQIYEGKYWETSLGIQHDVSGIPFVLLVDGDTGKILGTAKELRGPKLSGFIEEKLKEKAGAN